MKNKDDEGISGTKEDQGSETKGGSEYDIPQISLRGIQAMFAEMMTRMDELSARVEQNNNNSSTPTPNQARAIAQQQQQNRARQVQNRDEWGDEAEFDPTWRRVERQDNSMSGFKLKLPTFKGRNDADEYLEWETKVEQVFNCYNYSDEKKVKLAIVGLIDYALVWWETLITNRRKFNEPPIATWDEMKRIMRRRFVPAHYLREIHHKLQRLTQGSRTVEDYHKEMEILMARANIDEDREATISRFLNGLDPRIAEVVENYPYIELVDVVNLAIKAEKRQKLKQGGRSSYNSSSYNPNWRNQWPKKDDKGKNQSGSKEMFKPRNEYKTEPKSIPSSNSNASQRPRDREIKCFKCLGNGHIASQCPNRRVMMMREDGDIESDDEHDDDNDSMPSLEDRSDIEYLEPVVGESLVDDTLSRLTLFVPKI